MVYGPEKDFQHDCGDTSKPAKGKTSGPRETDYRRLDQSDKIAVLLLCRARCPILPIDHMHIWFTHVMMFHGLQMNEQPRPHKMREEVFEKLGTLLDEEVKIRTEEEWKKSPE